MTSDGGALHFRGETASLSFSIVNQKSGTEIVRVVPDNRFIHWRQPDVRSGNWLGDLDGDSTLFAIEIDLNPQGIALPFANSLVMDHG